MLKSENNKITTFGERLTQLKVARQEKFKAILVERGLPTDSVTFAEYIKKLQKSTSSNTTEE